MRFCEITRMARVSVPLILLALASRPAQAQFREISSSPADEGQQIEIHLAPTNQPFVSPRLSRQVPATRSTPTLDAVVVPSIGVPTPADPSAQILEPSPLVVVELKPELSSVAPQDAQPTVAFVPEKPPATAQGLATSDAPAAATDEPVPTEAVADADPQLPADPFAAFRRSGANTTAKAPAPQALVIAEPIAFNQVVPGVTTASELEAAWGTAAKVIDEQNQQRRIYRAPGFAQVDVLLMEDQVEATLVHLTEAMPVESLEIPLQLQEIQPVSIEDAAGTSLGIGYPERGVLLSYAAGDDERRVSHILLEPIRGELYRLRAESDRRRDFSNCLADLEQAVRIDPQDARAYWLQCELLSWAGRVDDALDCIRVANRIEPENALYQLAKARLQASNGQSQAAVDAVRNIADDIDTPAIVRARAEYLLGNLLANGPEPRLHTALNHHMKAIEVASKHTTDTDRSLRRMAKDILVEAHLAIAQDIALGNFQRQNEVVPKWLTRATELAEDYINEDDGDPALRMSVYRTTLAVYSVLEGNFDASIATDEAINESKRLIAEAEDRMYQLYVERELSETLHYAAKVEHRCGRMDAALRYANNAVVLLDSSEGAIQPSVFDRLMHGQLYFFTGSVYAVHEQDHDEAAKWYDKALPLFDDERLVNLVDASAFGDVFVSMGVSYWELGSKEKAIELTQSGAELMQQGVQSGTIERVALSVPYGNLAAMHGDVGNRTKADHYAAMMAKVEKEDAPVRR